MKKYTEHTYADCEDPKNHHKKEHWKTELCECCQLKKCECFGVSVKPSKHTPTPWEIEEKFRKAFHSDARVVAARKKYKEDLKNGMSEQEAFSKTREVIHGVKKELEIKYWGTI